MWVSRKEWEIVVKMNDQTRSEREQLDRGLGNLDKASKKAAESSKRSIIEIAKASKTGMEGIKAVLELGGWLMMARQVGKALMDITAEARKNSAAFKEAGAALAVVKNEIGAGLVKALEPLAEGFKHVLVVGTAVFENFPEVAKVTFDFVKQIMQKAFSWEGLKSIFVTLGEGMLKVFKSALEYLPKLFVQVVKLMLNPIFELGTYISDVLSKAFTLQFNKIISPGEFMRNMLSEQSKAFEEIVTGAKTYISNQADTIKSTFTSLGEVFAPETEAFKKTLSDILAPTILKLNAKIDATVNPAAAMDSGAGAGMLIGQQAPLWSPDLISVGVGNVLDDAFFDKIRAANEAAAQAAKDATWGSQLKELWNGSALGQLLGGNGGQLQGLPATILKAVSAFSSVKAILDPVTTIIGGMMEVLEPVVNNLLAPLVGILKVVGATIGTVLVPVLQLLTPIIEFVANVFLWLYNKIIVPVLNGVITAFNLLYNGVASLINGVIWIINSALGWLGVKLAYVQLRSLDSGTLTAISSETLNKAGSTGSGSSGSGANYAAGTSITIENIDIRADIIAGEAGIREVAIMIRDEILEAGRNGA